MTKHETINTETLTKKAESSQEKEAFMQLERRQTHRIGLGARARSTNSSFFLEVTINLSPNAGGEVDLQLLENALNCLKTLKTRGYSLAYEGIVCISCETKDPLPNPNKEYRAISKLINEALINNGSNR